MTIRKQMASRPPPFEENLSHPLSSRESEILEILATKGLSDLEIAEVLFVSRYTVHRHMTNIFNKLGVNSRVAAVIWAWQNGFALQTNERQVKIQRRACERNLKSPQSQDIRLG
jgi:DNA-binding NarL/FixJ family response regulator